MKKTELRKHVDKWQLIHVSTKEKIVHGNYALCRHYKDNFPKGSVKIIPFSFKQTLEKTEFIYKEKKEKC